MAWSATLRRARSPCSSARSSRTTRDRPARARAPSRAARRLALAHARRARRAARARAAARSRCARSGRSSAATSRARTSGSTRRAAALPRAEPAAHVRARRIVRDPGRARGPRPADYLAGDARRGAAKARLSRSHERRADCAHPQLAGLDLADAQPHPHAPPSSSAFLVPTPDEARAIEALAERFHFVITPYYASLMDPRDPGVPDPAPGGSAHRRARRPGRPRRPARGGGALAGEERDPRLSRPHRVLREQRVRALLPLLPAQAHGRRAGVGDEAARARARRSPGSAPRPRSATCCSRAAIRSCSRTIGSAGCSRELRAIPHVRDRAARHAAARDAAVPRDRRAVPHARALPPALAQHALQSPEGAHARGRGRARPARARGRSRSATRACCCAGSTTTRPR